MVFNSWLKSYRDSPMVRGVPNTAYYTAHHEIISRILEAQGLHAFVACNPDDADSIFGYLIGEATTKGPVVHWLYIKHAFRGWQIAKALFGAFNPKSAPFIYTHRTRNSEHLLGDLEATFNPYLLR